MPKGKKTCKQCGKDVNLRVLKCECGFEFKKKEVVEEPPSTPVNRSELMVVSTPGTGYGEGTKRPLIPVKPEGLNISDWIENCQKVGEKHRITYAESAFRYMARQIWHGQEPVLKQVFKLIAEDFNKFTSEVKEN